MKNYNIKRPKLVEHTGVFTSELTFNQVYCTHQQDYITYKMSIVFQKHNIN